MAQLLSQSPHGGHSRVNHQSSHDNGQLEQGQASGTGVASWRKGQGFRSWETELLRSNEVRRKADVAQLFFLDYYFDLISYVGQRKKRLGMFKEDVAKREVSPMSCRQSTRQADGVRVSTSYLARLSHRNGRATPAENAFFSASDAQSCRWKPSTSSCRSDRADTARCTSRERRTPARSSL